MSEAILANQTLGRYQLLVAVARGGMGQVWLARLQGARGFNKLVAIKTLLAGSEDRGRLEGMLLEEARIASLIQHANVVHTIELGEHEGTLYLVMEWVDGEPLGFLLGRASERGGMPLPIAVSLVSQVLSGLHAAHELADHTGPLGVVHRDVSPHNILVTYEGVAKLLDFGIAKATRQSTSNTETGEVKGKFSYMAPEQIFGNEVDRRCDVFATGIVLYLLTTGRHPFRHPNTAAVIHSITTDAPVAPPSTLVADYPPELEQVLLKALEKDVEKRWASAEEMRVALERAMPEAFGDGARASLREFMERTLGDRRTARREAVRRAQLAADARDIETGARKALQSSPGQSVSSLRAISISRPAAAGSLEPLGESDLREQESTDRAPAKRRARLAPWLAAGVGVALALGALAPRVLRHSAAGHGGVQGGASISAAPASGVVLPPRLTAPQRSAAGAEPLRAAPAASSAQQAQQAPGLIASSRPSPAKAASKRKASSVPKDKVVRPSAKPVDDLLAPEYAR